MMDKKKLMEMGLSEEQADAVMKELDGAFVPKTRFNEVTEAKNAAEKLAKDTAGQLQTLKAAGDPAELAKKLEEAKTAANTLKTDYEKQIKDMAVSSAVKLAVSADAHDPDLVASLLDHSKITLDDKGKLSGHDDQIKTLREGKPFLFKPTADDGKKKDTTITGFTPADGKDQGKGTDDPFLAGFNQG